MGAKTIKRKRSFNKANLAPSPTFRLAAPMPRNPDDPIPAIIPEDVDGTIIVTDPYVVADVEATGLRLERFSKLEHEKMILWLIDKSRDLDARDVDTEFAIDMGPEIQNRTLGATLAELARAGAARLMQPVTTPK